MFTIGEIIDLAVRVEQNGEALYRDAMAKVPNKELQSLLLWLADQEAEHAKWFRAIGETVRKTPGDPELEEMGRAIFGSILGDQAFSLKDVDFTKISKIGDLLEKAIEFEKDTILLYEMLGGFIDDQKTHRHLESIIREEEHHVELLKDFVKGAS
jgi:rubrerythrin